MSPIANKLLTFFFKASSSRLPRPKSANRDRWKNFFYLTLFYIKKIL